MSSRGILFILSAPAGAGKTTLMHMLRDEFPDVVASVSCTTRKPRPGEVDGVHYHFLSPEAFQKKLASGDFLEHAQVHGADYGTSRSFVEEQLAHGRHVFLVIDTQGAQKVRAQMDIVTIFLSAPSPEELRRRLEERKTETAERIEKRLERAKQEMEHIPEYDYHIINDNLESAYQALRTILIAEQLKAEKGNQ